MEPITIFTPLIVIALLLFLTLRLVIKYCKPPFSTASVGASSDQEAPDFTRVANHLFVSNTPHTYSRIYVDESANVRSVTITRIAPTGQHIVGYVLDPTALLPSLHSHHHHPQHPPTYEDSIKSYSPPKYDTTATNSTMNNSMELPTSNATTARVDGRPAVPRGTPCLLHARSMSDSWLGPPIAIGYENEDEEGRKSAR